MKTVNKMMTNGEIYSYTVSLINSFTNNDIYMPAAIAYSMQKNKATLMALAEDIEKGRVSIIQHYASSKEGDQYFIGPENVDAANAELNDLLSVSQEVKIYCFRIEDIESIQLTTAQIDSIMFMIDEE